MKKLIFLMLALIGAKSFGAGTDTEKREPTKVLGVRAFSKSLAAAFRTIGKLPAADITDTDKLKCAFATALAKKKDVGLGQPVNFLEYVALTVIKNPNAATLAGVIGEALSAKCKTAQYAAFMKGLEAKEKAEEAKEKAQDAAAKSTTASTTAEEAAPVAAAE